MYGRSDITEKGCVYRKTRKIYVICGNAQQPLGDGSAQSPLNLQFANTINWDEFILNDFQFFNQTVVYYNELGVQDISVQLYLNDS